MFDTCMKEESICGVSPWYWHAKDDGLWNIRYELQDVQLPAIKQRLKGKQVCVQAGGAMGMYPRIYSDIFDYVYTFEMNTTNFHFVVMNCQKTNIFKFNAALGEEHVPVKASEDPHNSNRGTFSIRGDGRGPVPTLRIDDLGLDACDLIHLDIEGYEIHALRGATETITKFKPLIVGEGIGGRDDCHQFLVALGYRKDIDVVSDTIYIHD